jgi:hypothetical protein
MANEWVWEPSVYVRGTPDVINDYKYRFANLRGVIGKGPSTVGAMCFMVGMEVLEKDPSIAEKLDTTDIKVKMQFAELSKRQSDVRKLEAFLNEEFFGDLDEFEQWAMDSHFDNKLINAVLFRRQVGSQSWHTSAKNWLMSVALVDGNPHSTDEVKQCAIDDKIIDGTELMWSRLRRLASRENLTTNEYGYWVKST